MGLQRPGFSEAEAKIESEEKEKNVVWKMQRKDAFYFFQTLLPGIVSIVLCVNSI